MRKKACTLLLGFLFAIAQGFPQGTPTAPVVPPSQGAAASDQEHLRLAATSDNYPVTPGDEYRLTYRQGDNQVTSAAIVDSDYTVGLGLFGTINASGMSFPELKQAVEKLILSGYPRSMPSLSPSAISEFQVFVRGEVPRATYFTAWGLSRVSDVLDGISAPTASLRNVELISRDSSSHVYDIFAALRNGSLEENPFVKPGDSIVLSRFERKVQIIGQVRMPGAYELLPGEQLQSLVDTYGGGLLNGADPSRVSIRRIAGEDASVLYVDLAAAGGVETPLMDGDVVTIVSKDARLPAIFIEGAVVAAAGAANQAAGVTDNMAQVAAAPYGRVAYTFLPGEKLSDALFSEKASISPLADLASAYVIREGASQPTYVDLRGLLSRSLESSDLTLRANDRIVIPYSNFSVFVSGAVTRPGSYPYSPSRTYEYYVNLAGGNGQESPKSIAVTDRGGATRALSAFVQPEDQIFVTPEMIAVQGAVFGPGSFAWRAGSPPSYYISLAGGADPERNPAGTYVIYDSSGKTKRSSDPLAAGDRIYLPNNGFLYNFERYFPLVTSILTTVLTFLTLYNAFPH